MIARKTGVQKSFDQAPGIFIGTIIIGIVRLVIAGVLGLTFVINNKTVLASTIISAIVIPIVAMVLFSLLKKNPEKNAKVVFGLRVGILTATITSLIIAIFGMSYYAGYSYTIFDTFVKDLIVFMDSGDTTSFFQNLVDDIFTIILLVIIIQSVTLASKDMPRGSKVTVPVQTQAPSPVLVPPMVPSSTGTACSHCGAVQFQVDQKFCEMCGTPYPSPSVTVVQPAVSPGVSAPAAVTPAPPAPTVAPASTITPAVVTPMPSPVPLAVIGEKPLNQSGRNAPKVDLNKIKDALMRAERKLEEVAGKAYERIFKKTPTQRNTRICIGVIALVIVTSIVLGASLTPARPLVGTWRTTFATRFYVDTDFRTGTMQNEGYQERTMVWVITATNDPNRVNVEVSFTVTTNLIASGSGYTPDVSPMDLYGYISASALTLTTHGSILSDPYTVGSFTFMTSQISGTWNDTWCMAYCQSVYTASGGLSLTK